MKLTAFITLTLTHAAMASTFSGRVTDGVSGIGGVDLDVFEAGTTNSVPTVNDNTDLNGFFSFDVPDGTYDVFFLPPIGSRYIGTERLNVAVSGPTDIGTVTLQSGFFLSGTVVRQNMTPVPGVPLRVLDSTTGERFLPRNDASDSSGMFSFAVPAGSWDLQVRPPDAMRLVAREFVALSLGPDRSLGTIVLEPGFVLAMTVRGPHGSPVEGVDIDVDRLSPAGRVFTPGDNSNSNGFVDVVAPAGALEVTVGPNPSTRFLSRILSVNLSADTVLPDVILAAGFWLSGTVLGPGVVSGADIDVSDTFTGARIPTENDDTDAGGQFLVVVPSGSFNLEVQPRIATRRAGVRLLKIDVAADVNVGTVMVPAGFLVSGLVANPNGRPWIGIDMDAFDSGDGEIPAIQDRTGEDGRYAIVVPSGPTDVIGDAELGSSLAHAAQFNVSVTGDTTINLTMVRASIATRLTLQEAGVLRGQFIHYTVDLQNHSSSPQSGLLRVEATLRRSPMSLIRRTLIAPTQVNLSAPSGVVTFGSFQRRVPPTLNPQLLRLPVNLTVIVTDLSGQTELDRDLHQFFVY